MTNVLNINSFIEVQFPVSKLSKESYKERKARDTQTLASLGKWHGRKPLVLVRALILGLLLPATDDPHRDREVFLKLMTMDDEGMWRRCKSLSAKIAAAELTQVEQEQAIVSTNGRVAWNRSLSPERRKSFEKRAFLRMGYDERLRYCLRPEEIDGPDEAAWEDINGHLGTSATSLPELVRELGRRRFGHIPRVGDAFAGGGSIPFEAARLGCEAFASDLNPTAALQCYGALRLIGGPSESLERVRTAQREVYAAVRRQVHEWGIERNEFGWEPDVYLYCNEVLDPSTGWRVPMFPSLAINPRHGVIVELVPRHADRAFDIRVHQGAPAAAVAAAGREWTSDDGVACPVDSDGNWVASDQRQRTSSRTLRGPNGLRLWDQQDIKPRQDDVYQERLFCIRWILPDFERLLLIEQSLGAGKCTQYSGWSKDSIGPAVDALQQLLGPEEAALVAAVRTQAWGNEAHEVLRALDSTDAILPGAEWGEGEPQPAERARLRRRLPADIRAGLDASDSLPARLYAAPTEADLVRERKCEELLADRFVEWQRRGYVPVRPMEPGKAIKDPIRNRGWTHWHHLYTPRQLLTNGLFGMNVAAYSHERDIYTGLLLAVMRVANHNSRLCMWDSTRGGAGRSLRAVSRPCPLPIFTNRSTSLLAGIVDIGFTGYPVPGESQVVLIDAATVTEVQDAWITDPGYGDMALYAEYSEFFLAWIDRLLPKAFPDWYTDSKRALAVELAGDSFAQALHRCYRNLAAHMPADGVQVVMFTQQDTQVWADLTVLLWAAGLQVIQAWTIATETAAGGKDGGESVQGTVCLVLRKRVGGERGDLSEIKPEVQMEVRRQLNSMLSLDDQEDPNFTDADLQLAAYAAALRVITSYERIAEIDIMRELERGGRPDPQGIVRGVIDHALREATDYLVPDGLERTLWRSLTPEERFYIKGVEVEAHGERRAGVYQEFARGFGVREFRSLLQSDQANETRLRTPSELKGRDLETGPMGATPLRHALYAVYQTAAEGLDPIPAVGWLRGRYPGMQFFDQRPRLVRILRYLADKPSGERMPHWKRDAEAAHILAARLDTES